MINLIPNEERKKMIKDFYLRFVVLLFFAFGFSVLVASVSILPSYFASAVKVSVATERLIGETSKPVPEIGQKTQGVIKELNTKVGIISRARKNQFIISERVINEIVLRKMSDIKITEITYDYNSATGRKIGVTGVAPSRDRLLLFRKALEDDRLFKEVDLPISNFLKGTNIQFYLNIIPS